MPDVHKDVAYSLVATAPSPATSGTSLVLTAGEGARFPTGSFDVLVCPASTQPVWGAGVATGGNFEMCRVTRSTDTLTITRAQYGTTARTVVVGDQVFVPVNAKTITDAENNQGLVKTGSALYYWTPSPTLSARALTLTNFYAYPISLPSGITVDRIGLEVTVAGTAGSTVRLGLYQDSGFGYPGALLTDSGTIDSTTTGNKEIIISQTLTRSGVYWMASAPQGGSAPTVRTYETVPGFFGAWSSLQTLGAPTSTLNFGYVIAAGAAGAFPDPFGTVATITSNFTAPRVYLRVT